MNLWLIVALVVLNGLLSMAKADAFTYDEHGKRDPFSVLVTGSGALLSYDSDVSVADLNLEGIMADANGSSAAIINGRIVKVSDQIGPYQVHSIEADHVELYKDGERIPLTMKKGGP